MMIVRNKIYFREEMIDYILDVFNSLKFLLKIKKKKLIFFL
jgi:hypothetical protein